MPQQEFKVGQLVKLALNASPWTLEENNLSGEMVYRLQQNVKSFSLIKKPLGLVVDVDKETFSTRSMTVIKVLWTFDKRNFISCEMSSNLEILSKDA